MVQIPTWSDVFPPTCRSRAILLILVVFSFFVCCLLVLVVGFCFRCHALSDDTLFFTSTKFLFY